MIKRIFVLMMVCFMLFPTQAVANDGGFMLDDKNYLSIKYELQKDEVEIGGTLNFSLILKNNTKYPIVLYQIWSVFSETFLRLDSEHWEWDFKENSITPGEKIKIEANAIIPQNVQFYKKEEGYFCDFDLTLIYDVNIYDKRKMGEVENVDEIVWEHYNEQLKITPLKITNLYDGSEIACLSLAEEETTFYFPEYQSFERHIYNGELLSELNNQVTFTNMSDNEIHDIFFISQNKPLSNSLSPNETITTNIENSYFIPPEDLPETLTAKYKVIFKSSSRYYALEIQKDYPATFLKCPNLKIYTFDITKSVNDEPSYLLEVLILQKKIMKTFISIFHTQSIMTILNHLNITANKLSLYWNLIQWQGHIIILLHIMRIIFS